MDLKHYHWWLSDNFLTCNKVQMWKIGSPKMPGRCFPSADIQKLRLTLFWTEGTRTWWGKHILLWQTFSINIPYTEDSPSLVLSFSLMAHFPCVSSLHGSRYKERGVMGIQWIIWKKSQMFGDILALTAFTSQADKSVCLRFHPQPPHTQRNSRVKKGEIGQRLRFQCWPVNGCLYKPVALSHDISRPTCCCCPKVCNPKTPNPFTSKPTVEPWSRNWERKTESCEKKTQERGEKWKMRQKETENKDFFRGVTSCIRSCVCLFLHDCVRTVTGVYVSWCFPAVFHQQTISHSKQLQKPSSPSPPTRLPIIPSALP